MSVVHLVDVAPVLTGGNADLARWLHGWADAIAAGRCGELRSLVVVAEHADGRLGRFCQSNDVLDTARMAGLLSMATAQAALDQPNFLAEG